MNALIIAEVATGSVVVGVSLVLLVAAIMIVAIVRYDVDSVLKIWGALGTLLGLVVGTMGTYFFTKDQIQLKDSQVRTAQVALQATQEQKAQLGNQVRFLAGNLKKFDVTNPEHLRTVLAIEDLGKNMEAHAFTGGSPDTSINTSGPTHAATPP